MGAIQAQELRDFLGDINLRQQISYQLTINHYPPVPVSMVDACIEAIDNANADEWDKLVELPEGTMYRGETHAPTRAIIEQHHLGLWIEEDLA